MTTTEENRDYSFSDGELQQRAVALLSTVTSDLADFAKRNVTQETLTAFEATIASFKNTYSDSYYASKVREATEAKRTSRRNLKAKLRTLHSMATNVFGKHSANIKKYAFNDISSVADGDLIKFAENAILIANEDSTALSAEGYSAEFVAELESLIKDVIDKIAGIALAERTRALATPLRVKTGNILYKEVVRLSNIGKDTFIATNAPKYNSYVIYGSPGAASIRSEPTNLRYNPATGNLEWDSISNATSYGVSIAKNNPENWLADLTSPTNTLEVPIEATGQVFYKVRARNSTGLGEYSEPLARVVV